MNNLKAIVTAEFQNHFEETPQFVARAPGRVNLIGEHTDYNDGFVLPCAIAHATWVAASTNNSQTIRVRALDFGATDEFELTNPITPSTTQPWSNYVRGVVNEMLQCGFSLNGCDLVISGNVPKGAGLSSSASLEIATGAVLAACSGLSISPQQLAEIGQRAENNFVGCACGIMDQLVSAAGRDGHAVLIDCRSLDITPVALPDSVDLVIVESGVERGLVDSEYNLRRQQCEAVAAFLQKPALRDVSLDQLADIEGEPEATAWRRALHVVQENQRVLDFVASLKAGDLKRMGELMVQSHQSLRDLFEVTTPELDLLVELIMDEVGTGGGARMTGGGFGGCVVALIDKSLTQQVLARINHEYPRMSGLKHQMIRAEPGAGVSIQSTSGYA